MKSVFAAAILVTAMVQVAHAQDVAAGDVDGQGVDGEWYVLGATGTPVKRMPDNGSGGFGY